MRKLFVVVALFLVAASPAAAFSGAGVSAKLVAANVKPVLRVSGFSVTATGASKTHTCQASKRKAPKAVRTPAVVACEQPPRSELKLPSAAQSVASALAQLG